jgi:hypothetical protein
MNDPGIGTFVRYWLHYSNLSSSLYKQFCAAKKVQEEYVGHILAYLEKSRMKNTIFQIGGGQIHIQDKRTPHAFSLNKIEELLHAYHLQRGGADNTKEIMGFINANRGFTMNKTLIKKNMPAAPTPVGGALPPPPASHP